MKVKKLRKTNKKYNNMTKIIAMMIIITMSFAFLGNLRFAKEENEDIKVKYDIAKEKLEDAKEEFVFVSNAPFDKFVSVKIDGQVLAEENYIAEKGSTKITLKKNYLKTLRTGKHIITIVSKDGEVSSEFRISRNNYNLPETGSKIAIAIVLFAIAAVGLVAYIVSSKKKEEEEDQEENV